MYTSSYLAFSEDSQLWQSEGERCQPGYSDKQMHPARCPYVRLKRMTDGDVSVDGGGDEHVGSGKHRHDLHIGHQLAQHVGTTETKRYLPRHLRIHNNATTLAPPV